MNANQEIIAELRRVLGERDEARRERDEWRDRFLALNQTAGEICNACGWAFKIPGEPCRCEVVRERDEARAEVDRLNAQHLERHLENWEQYMHDNDVKRAYRRGAEAMREACARECREQAHTESMLECVGHILALPIPEEP